jgi:hypothetical protein
MATGFQSNFNDSGYSLSGTWYNDQNVQIIGVSTVADIYTNTQRTGVFMIRGSHRLANDVSTTFYPVNFSSQNLINIGMPNNFDDAWLVYPGYGFTLYYDNYSSGVISRNYVNTSTMPIVYYCGDTPGTGWVGYGTPILTTGGSAYARQQTNAIRIYFRGQEIRVSGIA